MTWHHAPFVFIHIPKASGTSAEILLKEWRNISDSRRWARNTHLLERIIRPPADDAKFTGRSLYIGKRSGLAERAIGGPMLMATVLREPAERILSHFNYLRARARAARDSPQYRIVRLCVWFTHPRDGACSSVASSAAAARWVERAEAARWRPGARLRHEGRADLEREEEQRRH